MGGRRGRLFILSGPSGVGKGTLRQRVIGSLDGLVYSISCTTRRPRQGETDGVEYRFVTDDAFDAMARDGMFLEWARVHDARYGTLREDVERELDAGRDVLLEIDVQGAEQLRQRMPGAVSIFVAPPSNEELERRLRERGTEDGGVLALRLRNAAIELEQEGRYDHVIVNDRLDDAAKELEETIMGYRRSEAGR